MATAKQIVAPVAPVAPTASIASIWNNKFHNKTGHFVDIHQRLQDTINKMPLRAQKNIQTSIKTLTKDFKKRFPSWTKFSDIPLVTATLIPLSSIYIDTTMQREPDINWVIAIIRNFKNYQAQPIQVFKRIDGSYGAWDSQHTALAFLIIATMIYGENISTIMVPSNTSPVSNRGDLRNLFISMNSVVGKKNKNAGKMALELIDYFEQMVYGVEVDGVSDPDWEEAHTKWKHIRDAGLFVTASKFNNIGETGAISRLEEIISFSPEVIRQFCVYAKYVIEAAGPNVKRPIDTKEIPIITNFLALYEQNQLSLTDTQVESLAQHCLDLFDANFEAKSDYWVQVHQANLNAYKEMNKGLPKSSWPEPPKNLKNTAQGVSFFYHQLKHSWATKQTKGFKFPKQPYSIYVPNAKDLF